jgi:integrase
MVSHVFKRRRKHKGKVETSQSYYARYRLDGDFIIKTVCLDTSDKQVAEQRLNELIREKERERAGIIAPKLQRDSAKQNFEKHLTDYLADLKALGRSTSYSGHVASRVRRIVAECRWNYPADLSADEFVSWRAKQTEMSPKTMNDYLNSINALLNWMEKQGRIASNPLKNITKVNIRGRQQQRRAFTDEEFYRLLAVADKQRLLYLTAAYTGLRLGELRQLVWGDLNLTHERPHMKVRASTTKNKRDATLPIHPSLLNELAKAKPQNVDDAKPVFDGTHHAVSARRFVKDLETAKIERIDSMGRKLDFHCLRYTFATLLARCGVSQRLAQELMRHSDPRLTANIYTDVTCLPTFEAVHELPWLGDNEESMFQEVSPIFGTVNRTQDPDILGQNGSLAVSSSEASKTPQTAVLKGFWRLLAPSDADIKLAERGGFEPPVRFPVHTLSKRAL